jgi:hypothetical protein
MIIQNIIYYSSFFLLIITISLVIYVVHNYINNNDYDSDICRKKTWSVTGKKPCNKCDTCDNKIITECTTKSNTICKSSSPEPSPPPPPPPQLFEELKGISGSGYCKIGNQAYSNYLEFNDISLDNCKQKCKDNNNCTSIVYNSKYNYCQNFVIDNDGKINNASINYKKTYDKDFPTFASPWTCDLPLDTFYKCFNRFGYNTEQCYREDNVKCYKINRDKDIKSNYNFIKDLDKYKINIVDDKDVNIQIVLSNPFIPTENILDIKHTFYNWLLNLIKNANEYLYLINVYITLGKWTSDDPTNYENIIYIEIVNATIRGCKVYIINQFPFEGDDATACNNPIKELYTSNPNVIQSNINFFVISVFFHDKIYLSENEGYIGGQNLSSPSSIDFGITINKLSKLHNDLKIRAEYFRDLHDNSKVKYDDVKLIFNYNYDESLKINGVEYFLALSPFYPLCNSRNNWEYPIPQKELDFSKMKNAPIGAVGPYFNIKSGYKLKNSNVTYEWFHICDLISNANKFIKIINFSFSFFSSTFSDCSYDYKMQNILNDAVNRGVEIELWINNSNMNNNYSYSNPTLDPTCYMFTCPNTQNLLKEWKSKSNITINYWYSKESPSAMRTSCKILHAKVYYSDYGTLISSANMTPDYWTNTSNTGLCVRYKSIDNIPDWIKVGLQNIFDLLDNNKTVNKNTCLNNEPNINNTGNIDKQCPSCTGKSINLPFCTNCIKK